jgi:hypothetical protein
MVWGAPPRGKIPFDGLPSLPRKPLSNNLINSPYCIENLFLKGGKI